MSNVHSVLARVIVDDIDAAIPFYQLLCGGAEIDRFTVREVSLARIGSFLLLSGNTASVADTVATIRVASLAPIIAALKACNGHVVRGPAPGPTGLQLYARHPDGLIFEYVEEP
jgi:predicted enzyme related to lactoylglutathione lyase